jgi:SAM-dependent methyltransferase
MKQNCLTIKDVLAGYDIVGKLYPYNPAMVLWRAWEVAGYRRYKLKEPILDVGCGDGAFFRLLWPKAHAVVGVDKHLETVEFARKSGIYSELYQSKVHELSLPDQSFASAFANCSLEHMDHLPEVLNTIFRALKPGGIFLMSVVTEKFLEWGTLPLLIESLGEVSLSSKLKDDHQMYHHLVNPLSTQKWIDALINGGFRVIEYIPIVPELTSRLFLFLDNLWHIQLPSGELGHALGDYMQKLSNFDSSFRDIFHGVLQMENDWLTTSGLIFMARKDK